MKSKREKQEDRMIKKNEGKVKWKKGETKRVKEIK